MHLSHRPLLSSLFLCGLVAAQGMNMPMPAASKGSLPVTVKDARATAVPGGIKETAAFATLTNTSKADIVLTSAKTDVAGMSMLMNTYKNGALTGMKAAPSLTIPAGKTLTLAEMGDHIMLMQLKRPLKIGESIKITLYAKDGRTLTLKAVVKKPGM